MTLADKTLSLNPSELIRLMTWLSPSFPVGAFSYSHGLEWAVESNDISNRHTLLAWIAALLCHGGPWTDAVVFAESHRLARAKDHSGLSDLTELVSALAPTLERHLEATAQGAAFVRAANDGRDRPMLAALSNTSQELPYPVAVGVAAADEGIAVRPALVAFLHAIGANLVSAGVRLIPLGQTDGLAVLNGLEPTFLQVADAAVTAELDDLGGSALMSDIASARHEEQYTRLFRS